MTKEIIIADFAEKYAREADELGNAEWDHTPMLDKKKLIAKVALVDEKLVGMAYGTRKGDLFIYDVLLVNKDYRGDGRVGYVLNSALLNHMKSIGCKNCLVKSMLCPARRSCSATALKRFGFTEVLRVKGYWNDEPQVCKCCGKHPCECTCIFMLKSL